MFIISFLVLTAWSATYAQDSLTFRNGNRVFGEVKSMQKGVLTIETPYSDDDFTIKWNEILEIKTTTAFLFTLSNGDRFTGTIRSADSANVVLSGLRDGQSTRMLSEIVAMKSSSTKLKDRIVANVSVGYSVTKAKNAQQFSIRSAVNYSARRWSTDVSYNSVLAKQDEIADVKRKDGGINYNYYLPHDWYLPVSLSFLSNTEQLLKFRLIARTGIGKYAVHSNALYWGWSVGANHNSETYMDETPGRNSWECFLGTELNLFDTGDFSLLTRLVGYPSLTESGRFRTDFSIDTKYDLPLDFYISLGATVNYDNRPVEGGSDVDYVFQTTFGWKWD